jgi:DNA-binding XRE family transcriptional regulator
MRLKLIEIRKKKKMTQEGMAQMLGISRTTYTGYENGNFDPSLEKALKIKEILKYKNDDIFLLSNVGETNKEEE